MVSHSSVATTAVLVEIEVKRSTSLMRKVFLGNFYATDQSATMSTLARARLMRDIKEINEYSGFSCGQDDKDDLIFGDLGTKYEIEMFRVTLVFSEDYPFTLPMVKFDSEIFNLNINKKGKIDLDILEKETEKEPS